ncbi:MAG TPA: carbon-nitrogen hydrolase family protein [Spirochaetia bacterium]|nr:carbon-nitrogen hydrolase family protein [Spirochaetia bacterium]
MNGTIRVSAIQPLMAEFSERFNPLSRGFEPGSVKGEYFQKNLQITMDLIRQAGEKGSDFICTHEDVTGAGKYINFVDHPHLFEQGCDTVPGELTEKLGSLASRHGTHIIASLYERDGEIYYNTAVLIDAKGRVAGRYRKVQLAAQERFRVDGGTELPVFETPFGTIGILVCYDLWFPEISRILALKGARVLFNPTESFAWSEDIGICKVRTRAEENHVFLVVARKALAWDRPGRSCIVSPWGHIVADGGYESNIVVSGQIELKPKLQPEIHHVTLYTGIRDMGAYAFMERRPEAYGYLCEKDPEVLHPYAGNHLLQREDKERIREATRRMYGFTNE